MNERQSKKLSRRERRKLKAKAASTPGDSDAKEIVSTLLATSDFWDLCWYVRKDFEGDVGRRAQEGVIYDTLTRQSMPDGPAPRYDKWAVMLVKETPPYPKGDVGEAMLNAATRLRRVERRWNLLSAREQEILRFAYERIREAIPGWGETGRLVLERSQLAEREFRRARAGDKLEWLKTIRGRGGAAAELYFALQADARAILRPACDAWARSYRQRTGT